MSKAAPNPPRPRRRRRKSPPAHLTPWRNRLHEIIFEADTRLGKAFDVGLIAAILLSVLAVSLETVDSISARHGEFLLTLEWAFTVMFTLEYIVRLISVGQPMRYALSFFGVVDLLAVLPTYLSLVFAGTQGLLVIRILRLLRVFRVFKLAQYIEQGDMLLQALRHSRYKITVFLLSVLFVALIMGTLMYLIEGDQSGFTSIPRGMYWAVVTMTTVGYGDIAPQTVTGQVVAGFLMILGYSIIAVPTGIVSAGLMQASREEQPISTQACPQCSLEGHDYDALHCKHCGAELNPGS
ncbi:MAG: ion transporter [Deltaproteobacteria bacterium]|nr:ion transporter [Deltaproteobacteria bacterium]